ncbi:hypothetical protein AB0K71_01125 [Streptomyces syringium]|uniref:hypothetical protein n=1 Tax=Streptomyces syringium TaxID=76729 RepID=UPI00340C4EF6
MPDTSASGPQGAPGRGGPSAAGHPHHAPPGHRRRRKWPWVLLVLLLLIVGGCAVLFAVVSDESDKTVTVKYEVTGDAKDVTIVHTTWSSGNRSENLQKVPSLPWRKQIDTKGFAKGGLLAVTTGPRGGSVTCSVTVGDGKPTTATASGAGATATCEGF